MKSQRTVKSVGSGVLFLICMLLCFFLTEAGAQKQQVVPEKKAGTVAVEADVCGHPGFHRTGAGALSGCKAASKATVSHQTAGNERLPDKKPVTTCISDRPGRAALMSSRK